MDSSQTGEDFTRLTDTPAAYPGIWPFGCDQLIPCSDVPHQTCGCKNGLDAFAIVYNMDKTSEKKAKNNLYLGISYREVRIPL